VPTRRSGVETAVSVPFSIVQTAGLASQPFIVVPSKIEVQPERSLSSIGSGWMNPPPPRPAGGGAVCPAGACCARLALCAVDARSPANKTSAQNRQGMVGRWRHSRPKLTLTPTRIEMLAR